VCSPDFQSKHPIRIRFPFERIDTPRRLLRIYKSNLRKPSDDKIPEEPLIHVDRFLHQVFIVLYLNWHYYITMKRKVLIIEEDQDIRYIVRYLLEEEGYEVSETIELKVKEIEKYSADLILLDQWLNKRKEYIFSHLLKQNKGTRQIPIILLSTDLFIDPISAITAFKADDLLYMPFDMNELLTKTSCHLLKH